jgi:tetratricopeptide (TPR) repeat protein
VTQSAAVRAARSWSIAFLILLGCVVSVPGFGQVPLAMGSISGTVRDGAGRVLRDASILLSSTETPSHTPAATTDEKGNYTLLRIVFGHYWVSAGADGFRAAQQVAVDVNSPTTTVNFTLSPLHKGEAPSTFGVSSSGTGGPHSHPPSFQSSGIQGTTAPSGYSAGVTAEQEAQVLGSLRGLADRHPIVASVVGPVPGCGEAKQLLKDPGHDRSAAETNRLLGAFYLSHGEIDRSIPYLEMAEKADPQTKENAHNLAIAYLQSGRFGEASPILDALARQRPGDADLVLLLAEAYRGSGDLRKAAEEYRSAATVDSSPETQFASGIGLIEIGSTSEAATGLLAATAAHPAVAKLWMGLGIAEALRQEDTTAIGSLLHAVEIDPAYLPAYSFLANLSGVSEQTDQQIRERIETAVVANPENPDIHYAYALAMWKDRQRGHGAQSTEEIETQLHLVIAKSPNFAEAHQLLGIVFANSGDLLSSVKELERAAGLQPDNAKTHYYLARAYRRNGEAALADLEIKKFLAQNSHWDESATIPIDSILVTQKQVALANRPGSCDLPEK